MSALPISRPDVTIVGYAPHTGFDPCDGHDPHVASSPSDPLAPYSTRFTAWRVSETTGAAHPVATTGRCLDDVRDELLIVCAHKDIFLIREETVTGAQTVHQYAVKTKGKPSYRRIGNEVRRGQDVHAVKIMTLSVAAFVPIEPWRWTPGCDVVGNIHNDIIEGVAA